MKTVALTLRQARYTNKAFWRNPAAAFFTFAFPLMFLVIFTSLLGNGELRVGDHLIKQSTYYVASMASFAVITACYTNIAIGVSFQRDQGVLKRLRGTPLPASAYMMGRVTHAALCALLLVAMCAVFGAVFYDAAFPGGIAFAQTLVTLLVGAASFAALGLALTSVIPNADAAPPIVNASILPLLFLSGVFFPATDRTPEWITFVANIFPVRHFIEALGAGFLGVPFSWGDVLVVGLWGIAGMVLAARFFSWEPRR